MKKTSKEWSLHQLDELLTVVSGQVDPRVAPFRDMPHIGGENIESHSGKLSGVRTPAELGLQSGKYLFNPTDVLYSKIRPYLNKVLIPGFSGVCSADIYALRVDESKLDRHYLVYLLRSDAFLTYAEKHSTRTNIPKINRPALLSFSTYFPPLEEQRRIAAILDKADAVRRKRKEAIALTEELLRSAFLEMFGDPVRNPKGWSQRQLGEMLSIVSGQVDPQAHPYKDMPHIGGENIESNTGHLSGIQTPKELGLKSGKYLFEPTDVLYSKIRPYLNKVVIPGFTGVCSADIYPLRVDESQIDQRYLVYLLRSNFFLTYAEKHSARTNIPKINRPALLKFTLPQPPLALQKEFSVIYSRVECVRNRFETAVENNLFNSLLQRAFRGEL